MSQDEISKHAVPFNDEHDYTRERVDNNQGEATRATLERYESARDAIFDAVLAGKLDDTDLKIIEARNCSPVPSNCEVSRQTGIPEATIRFRLANIKTIMKRELD